MANLENHGKSWTKIQRNELINLATKGIPISYIAPIMGRTEQDIESKLLQIVSKEVNESNLADIAKKYFISEEKLKDRYIKYTTNKSTDHLKPLMDKIAELDLLCKENSKLIIKLETHLVEQDARQGYINEISARSP